MKILKKAASILLLLLGAIHPLTAQVSFGNASLFNNNWLFELDKDSADARVLLLMIRIGEN